MNAYVSAIRFPRTGSPDVLSFEQIILPKLGEHDVLVRHKAIGVNFIDTYHRSGLYTVPTPSGLGKEAAGVVEAVGSKVRRVSVGDRVCYVAASLGAYSEAHVVPESTLIILPEAVSFETAAAMMLKGLTAAYLLLKTHSAQSTDTFLIHAAAGGVSSILIPWAKSLGARVIGTVGRRSKVNVATENGCDQVLLYREQDIPEQIMALTDGRGVDVVYDSVGKDTFSMSLDSLKRRGLFVSFGNASGAVPDFPPLLLSQKGSLFFTRPILADYVVDPLEQQMLADRLFEKVLSGDVNVNIGQQFALSEASAAHRELESGCTTGSMILIPDSQC